MPSLASPVVVIPLLLLVPTMLADDLARKEMRVDEAIEKHNVFGNGVIVAILDRGLDLTHPDFRNEDGTTRVLWAYDLTDDSGASAEGNAHKQGTVYSRDEIDAALASGTRLNYRDAVGHGTTTTGLSAGNGRGREDRLYRGIAPGASIISVKVTTDALPAIGDEPPERFFYQPARLITAIDFVMEKAKAAGLPVVILLNLGSPGGPTDGSSSLARKIDSIAGPGKAGVVFVTGAGDDGDSPLRAVGSFSPEEPARVEIRKNSALTVTAEFWYDADRFADITIVDPDGFRTRLPNPGAENLWATTTQGQVWTYWHFGPRANNFAESRNGRRAVWLRLNPQAPNGVYEVVLAGSGKFDGVLNAGSTFKAAENNRFLSHLAPGTIWDGATALANICPNSYVLRTSWVDLNNATRRLVGEGEPGEIWKGSSVGPTVDGRLGIDFSAPGDRTIAAYAPKSYWATFRANVVQSEPAMYGMAGAVSAAAPLSTGAIALLLELNPNLDAVQIKEILQTSARADEFTGETPNRIWGHGKIDVLAALDLAAERKAPSN